LSTSTTDRMQALQHANEIRLARAELKGRIARGESSAAQVVLDTPSEARSWTVADLLTSQRRWGALRMRRFLGRVQIPERKTVGELTERQRRVLADALEGR
jgi:hypothetical protein